LDFNLHAKVKLFASFFFDSSIPYLQLKVKEIFQFPFPPLALLTILDLSLPQTFHLLYYNHPLILTAIYPYQIPDAFDQ
jgi:hypothetical protein